MSDSPVLTGVPPALPRASRRLRAMSGVALALSPWLDRRLAQGAPSWQSRVLAARSLQLTGRRNRCALACALDRLATDAQAPRQRYRSAVIAPCAPQVLEALPAIQALASRLRSTAPIESRGVARLGELLSDSAGPFYVPANRSALSIELEQIDRLLDVPD